MRRREFITLLGGAAAAWPLAARAQQPGKVYRLGVLADVTPALGGLFYGLRDLGYVEGQNLIIERRSSEGQAERWSELAAELVGLRVDAIVVSTTPAALAAKKATGTIPIIFPTAFDMVGVGLAESLLRPGGNVTAIYHRRDFVAGGGLMSYGTSIVEVYRQVGVYTGRILKGEKPADLPVLQPTKFELVINLKAANALGLTIPPGVLAIADEVIE